MNEKEAREIISQNDNPRPGIDGNFELYLNADYQGARRYIEAIEKANILKDILNLAYELHKRGERIATEILKDSLDQWEKEK